MKKYKVKVCLICKKEFNPTSPNQKYCLECAIIVRKDNMGQYGEQYYKDHKEKLDKQGKQWRAEHPNRFKEWSQNYKEERKEYRKEWFQKNIILISEQQKEYRQSPIGKEVHRRARSKRRELGFIPLNNYFDGSEAHHMNKMFVIYIPELLHKSTYHNIWTGQGMAEINFKVLQWFNL